MIEARPYFEATGHVQFALSLESSVGWAPSKELQTLCFLGENSLVLPEAFLHWREDSNNSDFQAALKLQLSSFQVRKIVFLSSDPNFKVDTQHIYLQFLTSKNWHLEHTEPCHK